MILDQALGNHSCSILTTTRWDDAQGRGSLDAAPFQTGGNPWARDMAWTAISMGVGPHTGGMGGSPMGKALSLEFPFRKSPMVPI